MALSDLFDGMKAGTDMYFEPQAEAQRLAKGRLALMGLEQQYADDQYLKPSQLADTLSRHQYNTALANANTSSLEKLRPLEDTNKVAALTLDTSKLGTAQQIQDATSGAQVAAGIADAKNKLFGATHVTPSEQQKQIAGNAYSTQDYGIKTEIAGKTRGDTVQTAMFTADTNRGTAEVTNQENQVTVDYFRQNPDVIKGVALDKIATAVTTAQTTRINSADQKYKAQLAPAKERLLHAIQQGKQQGIPVEQTIREALNSNDQITGDAAASVLQDMQKIDTEMKIEQIKAGGKGNQSNAQTIKQQRTIVAGRILDARPEQLAQGLSQKYGATLTKQGDLFLFTTPDGTLKLTEDQIRQTVAQENNALDEFFNLSIKKQRLEDGGGLVFPLRFGGGNG